MPESTSSTIDDDRSLFKKRDRTEKNSKHPNSKVLPQQNETTLVGNSIVATNTQGNAKMMNGYDNDDSQTSSTDLGSWDSLPQHVVPCPEEPSSCAVAELPAARCHITSLLSAIALSSVFSKKAEKEGKDRSPSKPGRSKNSVSSLKDIMRASNLAVSLDSSLEASQWALSAEESPPALAGKNPIQSPNQGFSPKIPPTVGLSPFNPDCQINHVPSIAEGLVEEETSPNATSLKEYFEKNYQTAQTGGKEDTNVISSRGRLGRSRSSSNSPSRREDAGHDVRATLPHPPFAAESPPSLNQFNTSPSRVSGHGSLPETGRNVQKRVRFSFGRPPSDDHQSVSSRNGRRFARSLSPDDHNHRRSEVTEIRKRSSTRPRAAATTTVKNSRASIGSVKAPQFVHKVTSLVTGGPRRTRSRERQSDPRGESSKPLVLVTNLAIEEKIRAVIKIQALIRGVRQRRKIALFENLKRQEQMLTQKLAEVKKQAAFELQAIRQEVMNSHEAARKEISGADPEKEITIDNEEDCLRDLKLENSDLKSRNEQLEERCRALRSANTHLESTVAARLEYEMELRLHCGICAENINRLRNKKQELKMQEKEMDDLHQIHTEGVFDEHRASHTYHWAIQEIIRKAKGTGDDSLVTEIVQIAQKGLEAFGGKPRKLHFAGEMSLPGDIILDSMPRLPTHLDDSQPRNKETRDEKPSPRFDGDDVTSPPLLPLPALLLWRPSRVGDDRVQGGSEHSISTDDSTIAFGSAAASLDEAFDDGFDDDSSTTSEESF